MLKVCGKDCGCMPDECGFPYYNINGKEEKRCKTGEYVINAPTIDAIPVEWLREFDLYYAGISGGSPYFRELMAAWQKEQEAR